MEFAKSASRNNRFSEEDAVEMVIKTLYGTAKLLNEKNMSFVNLINTVATKGGITEEGLKVLDNELPEIFNELFSTCIKKHAIIQKDLKENY